VEEVKFEKIYPTLDGNTVNTSTELRFTVPPCTDYFTR